MNLPFLNTSKQAKINPYVLLILDGFGLAPPSKGNPISIANTPNYDSLLKDYPNTELIASGESVGLPANEEGNTEVGHLTMGAGRVVLQDLKRIDNEIEKGRFYDNKAFLRVAAHVMQNKSNLHIMGLIGSGKVHSSVNHLFALLQFCKKEDISQVYLHLFTDGRDSPPKEGLEIIRSIEVRLKDMHLGKIASITGRYFAMDRDRRWDRTEKTYKAMTLSRGIQVRSAEEALESAYNRGQTDEFVEPSLIVGEDGQPVTVDDNDGVIFYNFRVDRPKQLTMAFVLPNFETLKTFDFGEDPNTERRPGETKVGNTFQREKVLKNLFFVTMTEYQEDLPVSAVAYGPERIEKPFSQVLSEHGLKQMHMAESEKERFVTYYFDGMHEEPFDGEDRLIIPSPKVATYDKKPEMSLPKLYKAFKKNLRRDKYHFFVVNFANPDMVAHTGDLKATIKAIECVDKFAGMIVRDVLAVDGTVLLTADHGNAEELITFPTSAYFFTTEKGEINTDHSNNPVPLILSGNRYKGKTVKLNRGGLGDITPTILHLMGIEKPVEMTGRNLITSDSTKSEYSEKFV